MNNSLLRRLRSASFHNIWVIPEVLTQLYGGLDCIAGLLYMKWLASQLHLCNVFEFNAFFSFFLSSRLKQHFYYPYQQKVNKFACTVTIHGGWTATDSYSSKLKTLRQYAHNRRNSRAESAKPLRRNSKKVCSSRGLILKTCRSFHHIRSPIIRWYISDWQNTVSKRFL